MVRDFYKSEVFFLPRLRSVVRGTRGNETADTISKGTCHVKTCWKAPRGDGETRLPDVRCKSDTATDSVNINAFDSLKGIGRIHFQTRQSSALLYVCHLRFPST